jgi:hypothetical protein
MNGLREQVSKIPDQVRNDDRVGSSFQLLTRNDGNTN